MEPPESYSQKSKPLSSGMRVLNTVSVTVLVFLMVFFLSALYWIGYFLFIVIELFLALFIYALVRARQPK